MALRRAARQSAGASPRRQRRRVSDRPLLIAIIVGLLSAWLVYAASSVGVWSHGAGPNAGSVVTAAPDAPVTPVPSATPPSTATQEGPERTARPAGPAASAPKRILYPAAQIDVAVLPLHPSTEETASQSILPPETMDGYWLAPFGIPGAGSTNTTYVVGHSWESTEAPFNHLSSMAAPGDELTVQTATGALAYEVDSVTTYLKSTLKDSPIWTMVPNRLVLISCYTGDLWGKNVVVVASPVAAS